jgi:hypothetical protein
MKQMNWVIKWMINSKNKKIKCVYRKWNNLSRSFEMSRVSFDELMWRNILHCLCGCHDCRRLVMPLSLFHTLARALVSELWRCWRVFVLEFWPDPNYLVDLDLIVLGPNSLFFRLTFILFSFFDKFYFNFLY